MAPKIILVVKTSEDGKIDANLEGIGNDRRVGCPPNVGQAAAELPDASITLSGGSMAVGVGITWASGTLYYKGKTYDVEVRVSRCLISAQPT